MKKLVTILLFATVLKSCKEKSAEKIEIAVQTTAEKIIPLTKTESEEIITIIQKGDTNGIQNFLKKGINVNVRLEGFYRGGRQQNADDFSNKEWTMLMIASFYNKVEIAELLLKNGSEINLKNKAGHTALFLACANRSYEMAEFLLKNDADATVDSRDISGTSTLQWALSYEWNDIAEKLLEQNVNVNSRSTETGRDVLQDALYSETISSEIISKLIDKGTNVSYINAKDGENALILACRRDLFDIVKKIIDQGGKINSVSHNGTTPLSSASGNKSCSTKLIDYLVKKGAKINPIGNYGRTPLIEAVSSKCIEKVRYLTENGANINQKSEGFGGVSPLSEALWETNFEITKYLLENGADVNIQRDNGETALFVAVWNENNLDAVDLLIKKGADVNRTTDEQQSPLIRAIQYNHYDIAVLLLKNGANADGKDSYGNTVKSSVKETIERTGNKKWLDLKL